MADESKDLPSGEILSHQKQSPALKNLFRELLLECVASHKLLTAQSILKFVSIVEYIEWTEYKLYQFLVHIDLNNYFGRNSKVFNDTIDHIIVKRCNPNIKFNPNLATELITDQINKAIGTNKKLWPEYHNNKGNLLPEEDKIIRDFYQFHLNFYHTLFTSASKHLNQSQYRLLDYRPIKGVSHLNPGAKLVIYNLYLEQYLEEHEEPEVSFVSNINI